MELKTATPLEAHYAGRHIALHRNCPRCEDLYGRVLFVASPVPLTDAADYLGMDPASMRQAIARGSLAATRVGTSWVVELQEVARYERGRNARLRRESAEVTDVTPGTPEWEESERALVRQRRAGG